MRFSRDASIRSIEKVRSIDVERLDKAGKERCIELIWELPFIALTYRDRCVEMGTDREAYMGEVRVLQKVVSEKMRELLGLPSVRDDRRDEADLREAKDDL
jgi:hypothetical protein